MLVTFHLDDRLMLGATVRMDLPEPRHASDLVAQLCLATVAHGPDVAVPVIIGGGPARPPELPYRWLMELVTHELDEVDVPTVHALWVPEVELGETWWCYENEECTGPGARPAILCARRPTRVRGQHPLREPRGVAAHLAPDREDHVAHRAQLLADQADTAADVAPAEKWATVGAAIDAITDVSVPELDDDQIVRLADALCDPLVRDNCLPLLLTDKADAAERLWTVLTRAVPVPERAEPASLLAIHAYLRGEGVIANLALDVALDANPDHQLALLLRESIDRGTPGSRIRAMVEESVTWAEQVNVEEEDR